MRIAFVVPGFAADEDDPGIPVLEDVLCRLQRHVSLQVIALRHPEPACRYTVHGIPVQTLGGGGRSGLGRAPLLLAAIRALHAEHRREPFSAIHGLWADEPGAAAVAAGRLLRIPSVVSVMGGELVALPEIGYGGALSRVNRLLAGSALRRADAVTAGCGEALARLGRMLPPSQLERVHLLPWGVDPAAFTSSPGRVELAGAFRVLHVGSLVPVKGIDLLLHAAVRARERIPGLHVHLVGDGPERELLRALAARLGLGDRVTFHGHVSRSRLGSYYRAADVLAVSSRHEMQPAVALEGAYFGLPVMGTAVGVLPDLAPDAAVAVPPGDVDGLAAALVRLAHPPEREQLSSAASASMRARYLADHTASLLLVLYSELSGRVVPASLEGAGRAAS